MKIRESLRRVPITAACCWFVLALADGQVSHPGIPADASGHRPDATDPQDEAQRQMLKKQESRRNEDRQKQLVKDTDQLLTLAAELKKEVGQTNKDVLSIEVVKKAEAIEKLARNVKDRMKYQ